MFLSSFFFSVLPELYFPSVFAMTHNFSPSKDSFVSQSDADGAYGLDHGLRVLSRALPTGNQRTFIEFDVSVLPSNIVITAATLKLYVTATGGISRTYRIQRVVDCTWVESTITWNNMPTNLEASYVDHSIAAASSVWWNVSVADVTQIRNDTYGYRIVDTVESDPSSLQTRIFHSKENLTGDEYDPILVLEYSYTYPANVDVSITDTCGCGFTDYDSPLNTSGLGLMLHMDGGLGFDIVDSSGYGNDGVLSGDGDEWVSRPLGHALSFDGDDDYVSVDHSLELGSNDTFTVEAWFKTSTVDTSDIIIKGGGYENFTTYTEVDEDGDITVTDTKVTVSSMRRDALSYVRKDYGAGFFDNFEHNIEILIDSVGGGGLALVGTWAVSNGSSSIQDMDTNNEGIVVYVYKPTTGSQRIYLRDYTNNNYDNYVCLEDKIYYLTIERSGTTTTCEIYNSSLRTASYLEDTLTITSGAETYQYIFAIISLKSANSPTIELSCFSQNLELLDTPIVNYRIWITGGYLKLNIFDGANDLIVTSSSSNYNNDVWHHVIGQWERGDAAYLYVDNVLASSEIDTITNTVSNLASINIGIYSDSILYPFDGFIDEVRFYNRVINVTERTYSWVHGEAHYDNYVYVNEDYYTFQAIYSPYWAGANITNITDLDTVQIGFSDGWHWMNASYDIADDEWSLLGNSSDYVTLKRGTSSYTEGNLTVTFPIFFRSFLIDALDVEIYMWCNNTDGTETNWELKAVDYFHIYNLGGQAEYTSSGTAGKLTGGDVLEIYANNASWCQANITFRKLQSVHLYVRVEGNKDQWDLHEGDLKNITFGMYVCPDGDDVWVEGWKVVLEQLDAATWIGKDWLGQRAFYIVWNASWYYKTNAESGWTHVITDTFSSFPVWNGTDNFYTSLWVDFWFNKINGSRLVGGRVNSEYFGIYNTASIVIFGWGTNFEAYLGNVTQSMFFHELEDDSGDVISSKQLKLMKFFARVEQGVNADRDNAVALKDYDIFSLRIAPNEMEGIDTPIFVASKMPSMPSTGFLEALFGGFTIMGKTISEAITLGALWSWNIFVDFLDSVATMLGSPNFFSNLFSYVSSFGGWMVSGFSYLITLITGFFGLITASMSKFLTVITTILSGWVDIVAVFINFLDGIYTGGFHVYDDYIANWLPLLPIGLLIYLYFRFAEDGVDAVARDIQLMINIFMFIVNFFITIIQTTITIISTIIESIPVVE